MFVISVIFVYLFLFFYEFGELYVKFCPLIQIVIVFVFIKF